NIAQQVPDSVVPPPVTVVFAFHSNNCFVGCIGERINLEVIGEDKQDAKITTAAIDTVIATVAATATATEIETGAGVGIKIETGNTVATESASQNEEQPQHAVDMTPSDLVYVGGKDQAPLNPLDKVRSISFSALKQAVYTAARPLFHSDADRDTSKPDTQLSSPVTIITTLPLFYFDQSCIYQDNKKEVRLELSGWDKKEDTDWTRTQNSKQNTQAMATEELSDSHSQGETRGLRSGTHNSAVAGHGDVYDFSYQQFNDDEMTLPFENKFIIVGPPPDSKTLERGIKHIEVPDATELLKKLSRSKHTRKHPLWVDMSCDHKTFEEIMSHIYPKVHPLTIEDCISKDCREKLEIFDHYLFISIRAPTTSRERTQRISIIAFKTIIFTYHEQSARVMDDTRRIIKRVWSLTHCNKIKINQRHYPGAKHRWYCPSPGWVCHAIVDGVIDALIPEVNRVVDEVQNLEHMVLFIGFDSQNEFLDRFQAARHWLAVTRTRLWPKSALTTNLTNIELQNFLQEVPAPYWRDINDHVSRMVDVVQIGLQTLESLQNVFVTKVSLEMSKHAVILSENASRLGATGAIFLPLIFIPTFYGMNIWLPFQNTLIDILPAEHVRWGFGFVSAMMIITVAVTYHLVKRSGWIIPLSRKQF
ncbi:magnesium and cobalt transport protein CorA, partial [Reticulomyxa filosa]